MARLSIVWLAVGLAGCGDPANVAGNYSISITNRDNGCNLANWTVGEQSTGIPITITQQASDATATIMGLAGLAIGGLTGSNVYTGSVDGNELTLEVFGTRSQTSGNCTFTYNSTINGEIDGDTLQGEVDYRAATNGNPDCAPFEGCRSFQQFNGTRPPS
jgi:hypothetical protein